MADDDSSIPLTALVVYWYDIVCFAIVGVAVLGALYVLWRREGSGRGEEKSMYESLLQGAMVVPSDDNHDMSSDHVVYTGALPKGHVGSHQLWMSCWRGLHPGWLLVIRFVSFCTLAGFLAWDVQEWGDSIFIYYTEWTFALVMVYFAIGTVISAHGCCLYYSKTHSGSTDHHIIKEAPRPDVEENRGSIPVDLMFKHQQNVINITTNNGSLRYQSNFYQEEYLQQAGFWGYFMQTAYQTCAGAVIMTDIVFWVIIVPFLSDAHLGLSMLMGCMHTLNAAFLLLDTAVNNLPFPWFRLSYFVLWSSAYVIFQWVIHACGFSWWPYPFLELSSPWAPLWYFILAVAHLPCYGLYALIVKSKNVLFSKWFAYSFVRTY